MTTGAGRRVRSEDASGLTWPFSPGVEPGAWWPKLLEAVQRRLEVALCIDQEVRADHNRFSSFQSPQNFSIAIRMDAKFYRARLEPAPAQINQHQTPYAGIEHRRIGHGEHLVFSCESRRTPLCRTWRS